MFLLKKLFGKIYSFLAMLPLTYHSPAFFWKKCGYKIGEGTLIGPFCIFWAWHHLDSDLIKIGKNVSIGPGVKLVCRSHKVSDVRRDGKTNSSFAGGIIVEDGAWICAGAIILPNIVVGKNAIVGAGAVVTKDVLPGTTVVGNPAKNINERMNNARIK